MILYFHYGIIIEILYGIITEILCGIVTEILYGIVIEREGYLWLTIEWIVEHNCVCAVFWSERKWFKGVRT